jgi:hypothetical protein
MTCHLAYPSIRRKKVRGGSELPEADTQKPTTPKCGQEKTKVDLFRDFFTKMTHVQVINFIPVKVSTLYIFSLWSDLPRWFSLGRRQYTTRTTPTY